MDRDKWHCIGGSYQDHPQEKEMQKGKMVVWGLTNSWGKKRNKRQRRKGKIYPFECRVPRNSKERYKALRALGSITTDKVGGDGIPIDLFHILKDDTVKMLHSLRQQIWKIQQWPQDWKGEFSLESQRKAVPENVKLPYNYIHFACQQDMLKILQVRFQQYENWELPEMYKLGLEKAEQPEIKLPTYSGS